MYDLLEEQYGVKMEMVQEGEIPTWNKEVVVYRVKGEEDRLLGHVYLDLYMRDDKIYEGGDRGRFVPIRSHSAVGDCLPAGAVVAALPTPGYGKPSLLSLSEVEMLLGLLGQMCQHVLSANKWSELSGTTAMEVYRRGTLSTTKT